MENSKELLSEFIEWLRNCGEDAFYVFDNEDEAIELFLKEYAGNAGKNE